MLLKGCCVPLWRKTLRSEAAAAPRRTGELKVSETLLLCVHQLNAHFSTSFNIKQKIAGCQSSDLVTQRLIAAKQNRTKCVR